MIISWASCTAFSSILGWVVWVVLLRLEVFLEALWASIMASVSATLSLPVSRTFLRVMGSWLCNSASKKATLAFNPAIWALRSSRAFPAFPRTCRTCRLASPDLIPDVMALLGGWKRTPKGQLSGVPESQGVVESR
ncbi:hypothetical protein B0H66DRAFT_270074 [Apodospora peruviana]|uniref:Uncharacterized protein n=1 Tax=Apodospora peruviana TaxID=516989 RepID=A0AAE0M2P0_9PEZI|nr:hypothetical protein B0H66DRAFT_270074 [Apodospora peruviana]